MMQRLIDANALIEKAYWHGEHPSVDDLFAEGVDAVDVSDIDNAPTIEAEPVVRCKECKHWKPSGSKAGNSFSDMEYIGGCEFANYFRRESDFCSYGEKKEGAA